MTLEIAFATFLHRLQLGRHQVDRINSAATTLSERLREHFDLAEDDVFLQGSYANRTAVRPPPSTEDGEYDVDLVVVSGSTGDSPRDAIRDMREAIEAIGYGDRIEDDGDRERPCIRLRYAPDDAGKFHVDVVPARRTSSDAALLEVPRPREGEWRPSAPQEYTQWCAQQGPDFAGTVQQLKRWRDETQTARQAIKSIVLQVLIANHMPHGLPDAERVAGALRGIVDFLAQHTAGPPAIPNPVLPTVDNLAAHWPPSAYQDFRKVVDQAATDAEAALGLREANLPLSLTRWHDLFGEDFPTTTTSSQTLVPVTGAAVATLDRGEEDLLIHHSIPAVITDFVTLTTEVNRGTTNVGTIPANSPLDKHLDLYFAISETTVPWPYSVYWKVKNYGAEAEAVNGLRGQITLASGGPNPTKHETTKYTGTHYIEVYVVKDGICRARAMQIVDIR